MGADGSVGVCRITNHENFDSLLRHLVDSCPLDFENINIFGQEVLPFHALFPGERTDQKGCVSILKMRFASFKVSYLSSK